MDHKRYEDWIFSEDELAPGDRRALAQHLDGCAACSLLARNWPSVRGSLARSPERAPAPGFAARWTQRLAQERERANRRRTFALLGASLAGAAFSFSAAGVQFAGDLEGLLHAGPLQLQAFLGWTAAIGSTLSGLPAAGEAAAVLFVIPAVMFFCAAIAAGAIAWLKMFRLLARLQGLTQWA